MNQHKQESNKKFCVGIFTERLSRTQYCHIQNPVKHLRQRLLQTANYQKKRNGKDSIKMITAFQVEYNACSKSIRPSHMDYYIFEQEIIFILSRAENVQDRNF